MSRIVKVIIAAIGTIVIIFGSVIVWIYIEIGFDGCCGAPIDNTNDTMQNLVHLAAYLVAAFIIILLYRWGIKPPANKSLSANIKR